MWSRGDTLTSSPTFWRGLARPALRNLQRVSARGRGLGVPAATKGLTVGAIDSMLFEGAFRRLRDHIGVGDLGPLDHVTFNYFAELPLIRFGPFGSWILHEAGKALLEIGPHPISGL